MIQSDPNGSAQPRQPPIFQLFLPMGLWFELPDTPANRRGAIILLRGLHRRDGWPLVTYERLAQQLGYADRQCAQLLGRIRGLRVGLGGLFTAAQESGCRGRGSV